MSHYCGTRSRQVVLVQERVTARLATRGAEGLGLGPLNLLLAGAMAALQLEVLADGVVERSHLGRVD